MREQRLATSKWLPVLRMCGHQVLNMFKIQSQMLMPVIDCHSDDNLQEIAMNTHYLSSRL